MACHPSSPPQESKEVWLVPSNLSQRFCKKTLWPFLFTAVQMFVCFPDLEAYVWHMLFRYFHAQCTWCKSWRKGVKSQEIYANQAVQAEVQISTLMLRTWQFTDDKSKSELNKVTVENIIAQWPKSVHSKSVTTTVKLYESFTLDYYSLHASESRRTDMCA